MAGLELFKKAEGRLPSDSLPFWELIIRAVSIAPRAPVHSLCPNHALSHRSTFFLGWCGGHVGLLRGLQSADQAFLFDCHKSHLKFGLRINDDEKEGAAV
jgi:hypothetical protein